MNRMRKSLLFIGVCGAGAVPDGLRRGAGCDDTQSGTGGERPADVGVHLPSPTRSTRTPVLTKAEELWRA